MNTKINICEIDSFTNHPFKVNNDDSLLELAESIKQNGLLNPIIVRKKKNERYEIISGHRRKSACELLGFTEIECIVKELSDEEATIQMVDSNIYREKILPSEKAFAYKMKMDAIKHQGKETCGHDVHKLKSSDIVGNASGESGKTVRRYIRLTYLIHELLELVDNTFLYDKRYYITLGITTAVELSYLNKDEQLLLYETIKYNDATPTHGQAIKIRELSKNKNLNFNELENILSQNKGIQNETISFNKSKIESALPYEIVKRQKNYIEEYIVKAIKFYQEQQKDY